MENAISEYAEIRFLVNNDFLSLLHHAGTFIRNFLHFFLLAIYYLVIFFGESCFLYGKKECQHSSKYLLLFHRRIK